MRNIAMGTTCADHTEGPSNYWAAFEWRKEMSKTHRVFRCADCLRFVIWIPRATLTDKGET
jgi:hypothetical protein